MRYFVEVMGKQYEVDLRRKDGSWQVNWNGKSVSVENVEISGKSIKYLLDNMPVLCDLELHGDQAELHMEQTHFSVRIGRSEKAPLAEIAGMAFHEEVIKAPMPGLVVSVRAGIEESVKQGQPVIILEAMKMENELRSPVNGVIKEICTEKGSTVEKGQILVVIERH